MGSSAPPSPAPIPAPPSTVDRSTPPSPGLGREASTPRAASPPRALTSDASPGLFHSPRGAGGRRIAPGPREESRIQVQQGEKKRTYSSQRLGEVRRRTSESGGGSGAASSKACPLCSPRKPWFRPPAEERSRGDGGAAAAGPGSGKGGRPGGPGTRRSPATAETAPRPPGEQRLRVVASSARPPQDRAPPWAATRGPPPPSVPLIQCRPPCPPTQCPPSCVPLIQCLPPCVLPTQCPPHPVSPPPCVPLTMSPPTLCLLTLCPPFLACPGQVTPEPPPQASSHSLSGSLPSVSPQSLLSLHAVTLSDSLPPPSLYPNPELPHSHPRTLPGSLVSCSHRSDPRLLHLPPSPHVRRPLPQLSGCSRHRPPPDLLRALAGPGSQTVVEEPDGLPWGAPGALLRLGGSPHRRLRERRQLDLALRPLNSPRSLSCELLWDHAALRSCHGV
ncbi:WAS/WASL-interacting protein family member 3-like [Vombatus ursinus]|uniref:WAS/WASL-interacting protein family member 3-like n=1 Tax=Vombatus ursinus TaxID=29139 RepID=UPI000FFD9371|nr:WAS/WASL-interacting protein family member 3-like [Vombatus ursinus]